MIDRIGDDLKFHQTALALRQQRQEVLAANIANADTPGFKARDFAFSDALRQATQGSAAPGVPRLPDTTLAMTSERHIPGRATSSVSLDDHLRYRVPLQPSLDGNTVDMDVERVQFADNTQRYQADIAIISARIKGLLSALQQ